MPEWDSRAQGVAERSAKLRAFFARYVATTGGARDPRIEQAFAAVPREPFAGPAPLTGPPLPVVDPLRLSIDCLCAHGGLTGHPQVSVPGALVDGLPVACGRTWVGCGACGIGSCVGGGVTLRGLSLQELRAAVEPHLDLLIPHKQTVALYVASLTGINNYQHHGPGHRSRKVLRLAHGDATCCR